MRSVAAIALVVSLALLAPKQPHAQDVDRLTEDLGSTLRDLFEQMEPALDEAWELLQKFQGGYDPRHYQMPEVLPNGDIIIRRRGDAPPFGEPPDEPVENVPPDEGTIDL